MSTSPNLQPLNRLVGTWTTEATHPAFFGVVVRGSVRIEWLEGERFLIHRARCEHPDFPDSISIIGFTERDRADSPASTAPSVVGERPLSMHYYDSRGVSRVYETSIDADSWRIWRNAPGFSQRFTGMAADGGDAIVGRWQLRRDDGQWNDDLQITYRRSK